MALLMVVQLVLLKVVGMVVLLEIYLVIMKVVTTAVTLGHW
jgi:hypothetical protein